MRALAFFLGLAAVFTVNDAMSGEMGRAANPADDMFNSVILSSDGLVAASGMAGFGALSSMRRAIGRGENARRADDSLDRVNRLVEIPVLSN